ncbi:putative nuclease HARBI1 isoform X2 [Caloenas nicobarica]|uniref:putative nuclease HARBI1 isoform X2 n=1 Tax=Caloenas nicobarica TaxID=187106 RepID=UPI0032B84D23
MSAPVLLLRRVRERGAGEAATVGGVPGGGGVPAVPAVPAGPPAAPSPSPPRRKRVRRRRFYPEHRVYRARCSFLDLSEEQVLRRYRLDKAAIAALCRELGADLESLTGRSHALPVAVKVTAALAFLASGSFQAATRAAAGISQSAVSNCLAQFLEALRRRAARHIAFPAVGAAAAAGAAGAFPGVLGLVGAMHVALRAPSRDEPAYRNAGNFHSVNAQFPGSCPNAAVLENSALARLLDGTRPDGAWLLGDGTYPLKPWLLTPIAAPRGPAELRYNALHHGALGTLRRTLWLLPRRWRCLDRARGGPLQYAPPKVCRIFLACCVLHNIALRRRLPLPDGPHQPDEGAPPDAPQQSAGPPQHGGGCSEGRAVRARVVQQVREGRCEMDPHPIWGGLGDLSLIWGVPCGDWGSESKFGGSESLGSGPQFGGSESKFGGSESLGIWVLIWGI